MTETSKKPYVITEKQAEAAIRLLAIAISSGGDLAQDAQAVLDALENSSLIEIEQG